MKKNQLTKQQHIFLTFFGSTPSLYSHFYLTGGTCLSEYYLHHRYSEDLDFFSEHEFTPIDITTVMKSKKKEIGYQKIDFQQSFNRNLYHLIFSPEYSLKVEFTYFPFKRIDTTSKSGSISIDSLKDIAVNKIFTILQNPRGRDFYDVYFILQKEPWTFEELLVLARNKFDFHIDYLQFGTNLLEVSKLQDDPLLKEKIDFSTIQNFFLEEAKKLKSNIMK